MTPPGQNLHASCVAVDGHGLLILGSSGAGKSSLALRMIGLGAKLVADDRIGLVAHAGRLTARCPAAIKGLVEARGVGLLCAPMLDEAEIDLAVDLDQIEDQRLPPRRQITILGCEVDLVLQAQNDHFPAALMLYLRHGRYA